MASSQQMLFGENSGAAAGFTVDAADFDGTNDWLEKAALFSPAATNSKTGILSFWIKFDTIPGTGVVLFTSQTSGSNNIITVSFNDFGVNTFEVTTYDSVGTTALDIVTTGSYTTGVWYNFLASWNMASAGQRWLYINNTSDLTQNTFSNLTTTYSTMNKTAIAASDNSGGVGKIDAGLAEFYFAPNQVLDLSVSGNRAKFITAGNKPVNLGTDGSTPTGTKPLIYLHLDDGEAAANFATNRAGNGNMPINGTLTTYANSPSD